MGNCRICNKEKSANDLRYNVCWDCAEAESIIDEGVNMEDKGNAKTPMDKLRMLIQYGWSHGNDLMITAEAIEIDAKEKRIGAFIIGVFVGIVTTVVITGLYLW